MSDWTIGTWVSCLVPLVALGLMVGLYARCMALSANALELVRAQRGAAEVDFQIKHRQWRERWAARKAGEAGDD